MARISIYNNNKTEDSTIKIEKLLTIADKIDLPLIEKFQLDNGISNTSMALLIGMDKSQFSKIKAEKTPLVQSHKMALALVMAYFKTPSL